MPKDRIYSSGRMNYMSGLSFIVQGAAIPFNSKSTNTEVF